MLRATLVDEFCILTNNTNYKRLIALILVTRRFLPLGRWLHAFVSPLFGVIGLALGGKGDHAIGRRRFGIWILQ